MSAHQATEQEYALVLMVRAERLYTKYNYVLPQRELASTERKVCLFLKREKKVLVLKGTTDFLLCSMKQAYE